MLLIADTKKVTWMFHTTASLGQGFVHYCDKSGIPWHFGIWRGKNLWRMVEEA